MDEQRSIEGRYANYFAVGLNPNEIVLDFAQSYGDTGEVRIHTRIITSPAYAPDLLHLLQSSLREYETRFGPIGLSDSE